MTPNRQYLYHVFFNHLRIPHPKFAHFMATFLLVCQMNTNLSTYANCGRVMISTLTGTLRLRSSIGVYNPWMQLDSTHPSPLAFWSTSRWFLTEQWTNSLQTTIVKRVMMSSSGTCSPLTMIKYIGIMVLQGRQRQEWSPGSSECGTFEIASLISTAMSSPTRPLAFQLCSSLSTNNMSW